MIASENVVIMQMKAYYKERARNIVQMPRMLMIVYIKSTDDVKDLFVNLVNNLIDDSSEYLWKFVLDGRNESQLSSLEEYLKEPKSKVSSVITIQLTKTSSKSVAMILGEDDKTVAQTDHFKITTANDYNKYIRTNGIEIVIRLEDSKTDVCKDMIKTAKEVKEEIVTHNACVIGSTDIECKDDKGSMANKVTPSGIMYASNGVSCKNTKCSADQTKLPRKCHYGAFNGQTWCRDMPKCTHGGLEVGGYCFLVSKEKHDIEKGNPNACSDDYPGYSSVKYELFAGGVPPALNQACAAGALLGDNVLITGLKGVSHSTPGKSLVMSNGKKYGFYSTINGRGEYLALWCENKSKKIVLMATAGVTSEFLCVRRL